LGSLNLREKQSFQLSAGKAIAPPFTYVHSDPRFLDEWNRSIEVLRKAGMPEE
jgi:hypothetical protein